PGAAALTEADCRAALQTSVFQRLIPLLRCRSLEDEVQALPKEVVQTLAREWPAKKWLPPGKKSLTESHLVQMVKAWGKKPSAFPFRESAVAELEQKIQTSKLQQLSQLLGEWYGNGFSPSTAS